MNANKATYLHCLLTIPHTAAKKKRAHSGYCVTCKPPSLVHFPTIKCHNKHSLTALLGNGFLSFSSWKQILPVQPIMFKGERGRNRGSQLSASVSSFLLLWSGQLSLSVSVLTESYWTWNFTTLWGAVHMMSMWAGSLFTESLMIPVQGNPFGSPMTPLPVPTGYFHPSLEQGEQQICFDSLNPSSLP